MIDRFTGDGIGDLTVGRLPARTLTEAGILVKKLIAYQQSHPLNSALLVSDINDGYNFEQASDNLKGQLPGNLQVEEIKRGREDAVTAKARLFDALNRGQKVVNYVGHGSLDLWRGSLLTATKAEALTNQRLGMFVMMTWLNGYFEDAYNDSLSEGLMKTDRGAAIAVGVSLGITLPGEQARIKSELYRLLFGATSQLTIGEAVQRAKQVTANGDIRKTWILLGDPTLRLK